MTVFLLSLLKKFPYSFEQMGLYSSEILKFKLFFKTWLSFYLFSLCNIRIINKLCPHRVFQSRFAGNNSFCKTNCFRYNLYFFITLKSPLNHPHKIFFIFFWKTSMSKLYLIYLIKMFFVFFNFLFFGGCALIKRYKIFTHCLKIIVYSCVKNISW